LVCNAFYEGAPYLGYNNQRVLGLADFKEVYHLRWGIEEGFKMFKSRANIEAFHRKTLGVGQSGHLCQGHDDEPVRSFRLPNRAKGKSRICGQQRLKTSLENKQENR
jgi:hypothetical protein